MQFKNQQEAHNSASCWFYCGVPLPRWRLHDPQETVSMKTVQSVAGLIVHYLADEAVQITKAERQIQAVGFRLVSDT